MKPAIQGLITICFVLFAATGCKKQIASEEAVPQEILSGNPNFGDNISVSSFGFLVFPTDDDLEGYREFVSTSTHYQVQNYLDNIGFESRGHDLYTTEAHMSQTVSAEQVMDYVLTPERTFQLEDVIMKPIEETTGEVQWSFLLAMREDYLSNTSYESMIAGVYNGSYMNQFATNPETEGEPIMDIMKESPIGIEETVANSVSAARPFWGYGESSCSYAGTYHNPETNTYHSYYNRCDTGPYYIFWIRVKKAKCHTAYSCS